jgi:hypothetical protein
VRRDEGDDGRAAPVSHCGGSARGWAALGPKLTGSRRAEGGEAAGGGNQGAQPDFGKWVVQQINKREMKGFRFFLINQTNEIKHTFEFKHSKIIHQHVCNNKLLYFII